MTLTYSPIIIVNRLPKENKNSLWQHMKDKHPQKANNLASVMLDPFVKLITDKKEGLGGVASYIA